MFYYEVALSTPLNHHLTYHSSQELEAGQKVSVPLRNKKNSGIVVKKVDKPKFKTLAVQEVEDFKLNPQHLKWLQWIANYYLYPEGLVINSIFPPLEKKERKKKEQSLLSEKVDLTKYQEEALQKIFPLSGFKAHLLHGVTGSGKTEIYMELFEDVIFKQGKQGLFLLPEISLTPQLEGRFKKRFGNLISVYHSQMTPRQKTNSWYDFMEGQTKILIGARSALFCPSENIGLIVIDEEHESSFKQEEKFLYHARDAALKLAHTKNIPLVMGSATPSLESFKNAQEGKYNYIRLQHKVFEQGAPPHEIVNMCKESASPFWLSNTLKIKIENHLARKKQIALFLNRRGWASFMQCYDCGHSFHCLNCDVTLTLHNKKELYCHYCGYGEHLPATCPECSSEKIQSMGLGTEQVVHDIENLFPQARILKFDRDEIQTKNQLKDAIQSIEEQKVDLIVGTQMIAKGLDFPNLTLMGVLDADLNMSLPDFRAGEKSLQQLLQVLGRVGRRKEQHAEVVIQSRSPEHFIFQNLNEKKYEEFASQQLKRREIYNYPPYSRMVALIIKSKTSNTGESFGSKVSHFCKALKEKWPKYQELSILGPCPAPLSKVRNEFRYQILLKFPAGLSHKAFLSKIAEALGKPPTHTKLQINVDPVDLM